METKLKLLVQYSQLDAAKGRLVRKYFDELHWLDFADGFSDLELGRLFDMIEGYEKKYVLDTISIKN